MSFLTKLFVDAFRLSMTYTSRQNLKKGILTHISKTLIVVDSAFEDISMIYFSTALSYLHSLFMCSYLYIEFVLFRIIHTEWCISTIQSILDMGFFFWIIMGKFRPYLAIIINSIFDIVELLSNTYDSLKKQFPSRKTLNSS